MSFNDIFKEEEDFENSVKEIYKLELQMASATPKMERQTTNLALKKRLRKLKERSKAQVRRIEDLCDIYDIVPDGRTSLAVESLLNEAENLNLRSETFDIDEREAFTAAQRLERQERQRLRNALHLAERLNYREAVEILTEARRPKPIFINARIQAGRA